MYSLRNLKAVIRRQQSDGGLDIGVIEDFRGDLIQGARCLPCRWYLLVLYHPFRWIADRFIPFCTTSPVSSTAELSLASCLGFACESAVRLPTNRLFGVLMLLASLPSGAVGKAPGITGSSIFTCLALLAWSVTDRLSKTRSCHRRN